MRLSSNDVLVGQYVSTVASCFEEEERFESIEEIEAQSIGDLLPNDDDLLSGVIDDIEYIALSNCGDDTEYFDLFSSGGGMELEGDDASCKAQRNSDYARVSLTGHQRGTNGFVPGGYPYGEHPSRTLFVRNINSNVEDFELRVFFEVLDISLYLYIIFLGACIRISQPFFLSSVESSQSFCQLCFAWAAIWGHPYSLYGLQASGFCYDFLL